jgi:hypothetical protein
MGIVGWLYSAQQHGIFPKLLLLDEPDARLHPSMTRQFLDIVNELLVGKYRIRVIMSTHSPSTVALAPEGSVFEMSRDAPRVRRSESREKTVALLTAGLVTVTESTRYVFVEDADDARFYGVIRDLLTDYGPAKDPYCLAPVPSIVFLSVSAGAGGGKMQVAKWVEKFDNSPLESSFLGLIDLDTGNAARSRMSVIGRYSIENYMLDPLTVYGALLDVGLAPRIQGVDLVVGKEHTLKMLEPASIQSIANAVIEAVKPKLGIVSDAEKARVNVPYTTGALVELPMWLLYRSGHDLMNSFRAALGAEAINKNSLLKASQRVRMIPSDLAGVLRGLQV